jgi:hypothetical protein
MSAHSYWRLNITAVATGKLAGIAKWIPLDSGGSAIATTGGTASASSNYPGQPASNAFDGNTSTFWLSNAEPSWLQYQFASPVDIVSFTLTNPPSGNEDNCPQNFQLQYSDNGTTWTTLYTYKGVGWGSASNTLTFNASNITPASPPICWRLNINTTASSANSASIAEWKLYDASSTQIPTSLFSADASSTYGGQYGPSSAFDGNTSTFWNSSAIISTGNPQWLRYDFATSVTVASFSIQARPSAPLSQTPATFDLQYSTDAGATWTTSASYTAAAWTTNGQTQTFNVPSSVLSPSSANQLTSPTVTATGTNTHFVSGTTTVAVSGTGVTVGTVTVSSGTSLTAALTVSSSAPPGTRTVTITTGSEVAIATFTVIAGSAAISLSPTTAQQGAVLTVSITGTFTHFVSGTTTVAVSGTGVTVGTLTVSSGTSLTAALSINSSAAATARTLTVTTGSEAPTATFTITTASTSSERGHIDFDQLRASARLGTGTQIQMAGPGGYVQGNIPVYDVNGNLVNSGANLPGAGPVGTVAAVGLSMPADFTVTGSPLTGAGGTLAVTGGVSKNAIQQQSYLYAADTGAANAYAVSLSPAPTLAAGSCVVFKATNANTGASTLAVNGGTATPIKKNGSTALASGDIAAGQIAVVVYDGTNFQLIAGATSGGGGGISAPAIRGSGIQASSNSSYTVNWPTGTAAGDLAVIAGGHGFGLNNPTGWTVLDNSTGSNWNGAAWSRALTAADITTGHVTITTAGSFDGALAIITFVGSPGGIRATVAQRNGAGASSITLNTDGSPLTTDVMVYFGSNRAASTDTVSLGSNLQQANDGSAASACLFAGSPAAIGGVSPVFSYSAAGSGNYQAAIAVKAIGT